MVHRSRGEEIEGNPHGTSADEQDHNADENQDNEEEDEEEES